MGGKAILLVVFGLSATLMTVNQNYSRLANLSIENVVDYQQQAEVHSAAVSGANMVCHEIFKNPTLIDTVIKNKSLNGADLKVWISVLDAGRNIRRITSFASKAYNTSRGWVTLKDTVMVTLQPSNFSKFAYYSADEGGTIYWTSGDTVWGPFHTQDNILVSGNPVFFGRTTTKGVLQKRYSSDNPKFMSTFEDGVDLPLNEDAITELETAANTAGFKFPTTFETTTTVTTPGGWKCVEYNRWGNCSDWDYVEGSTQTVTTNETIETIYLTFEGNNIKYKFNNQTTWTTKPAATFSNNGVIFAKNVTLRLKGTVKGQFTVACSGSSGSKGDIYLDDDVVYNTKPDQGSSDILGIVAENDVIITQNSENNNDININASIYCQNGGFGAENYSSRPKSGNINLIGGIIQETRAAVGTFGSYGITAGFNKRYKYDDRFMFSAPPKYPNTGSYEILSWYE